MFSSARIRGAQVAFLLLAPAALLQAQALRPAELPDHPRFHAGKATDSEPPWVEGGLSGSMRRDLRPMTPGWTHVKLRP